MGSASWQNMDQGRETLIMLSAILASDLSGNPLEEQLEYTIRDVMNISDLYLERLESNYALSGQAFAEDEVIVSDLNFCGQLISRIDSMQ